MKDTWEAKWEVNHDYFERNFKKLQELYGRTIIVVLNEQVILSTTDYNDWRQVRKQLSIDEQLEAYHRYIPGRNEVIVI